MKVFITFIAIFLISSTLSFAQFYEKSDHSGVGLPFFEVELFRTFSKEGNSARIYLYNEILYDDLTFIKQDTLGFRAEFEIDIAIFKNVYEQVAAKTINKIVFEKTYNLTNSRDMTVFVSSQFDLPPGEYELKLQMNDLISKKFMTRKIDLNLKDLSAEQGCMSDILFMNAAEIDSSGSAIKFIPRVKNNFPRKSGDFYVYFELYTPNYPTQIKINYKLKDQEGGVEIDTVLNKDITENISDHYFLVNIDRLKRNAYNCIVNIEGINNKIENSRNLSFYWVTVPETLDDIELALRQMVHIIPYDSLSKYEATSLDQQRSYFISFWNNKDPNPNTAVNELMEEYFKRINYANQKYSNWDLDGWKTDRGRILIKFGFPDDIERHPFETDSVPYIIWRYYALRRMFVFSDRTGFGDFRLLPQYYEEEFK